MDIKNAPLKKDFAHNTPNIGFKASEYMYAIENWAKEAEEHIKKLEHYRDTTEGLWATDRPDLVDDSKGIMFQLKS